MIALVAALVALIGLVMYCVSTNGKVSAIGFAMFQCGLLVTLFVFSGRTVKLL